MPDTSLPVVIVGAGLAGLCAALTLAGERRVVVLAKCAIDAGATPLAQGGIVGVLAAGDSVDAHVGDTQRAGAGLVDEPTARFISAHSAAAIEWLLAQGVPFTRDPAGPLGLHLTREGGHGMRRIAHAADATGQAIHAALLAQAAAHPRITLRAHVMAVDLLLAPHREGRGARRCIGLQVLDIASGQLETLGASQVVLATGGVGMLYRRTTNPATATGDGIAMAWRAGCRVANMEFMQFHPTCLFHPEARGFLITEALRGEGAVLRLPDGTRFMPAHDERAELAPRDVVARGIDLEMKRHGLDHVQLDATHLGAAFLQRHFPTVHARCLALGIDIARQPIPVVPAAHYTCGGIVTELDGGTDLAGLYAVGEASCTGLHGANRLASNSLLECVVLGRCCAAHILTQAPQPPMVLPACRANPADAAVGLAAAVDRREALRRLMSDAVGIVRSTQGLEGALHRITCWRAETDDLGAGVRMTRDRLELRNLTQCAELVVRSALSRRESRGLHCSQDFPDTLAVGVPTVLRP